MPLTLAALLPAAGAPLVERLPWLAAGLAAGVVLSFLVARRGSYTDGDTPVTEAHVAPAGVSVLSADSQFQALVEAVPGAMALTDPHGRLVFANSRWGRLMGIDPVDAAGDGWRRAIHPADRSRIDEKWALKVAFGESCVDEFRVTRGVNETAWLVCQSSPVAGHDGGGMAGHVVLLEDVTARREAGLRLSRLEEQAQLLEEAMDLAWLEWDLETNRVTWSPRLFAMLSGAEREADPTPLMLARLAHPSDREALQRAITRHLAGQDALRTIVRLQRPDGAFASHLVTGANVRDRRGRPTRLSVAITALPDAA